MNKKLLYGMLLPLFAVILVSAIALTYYAQHEETLNVIQPISVNGEEGYMGSNSIDCEAGDTCIGTTLAVNNKGSKGVPVTVMSESNEDVSTSFIGETILTKKTVDFSLDVWEIPEDAETVTINYNVVSGEFDAELETPIEGYELIYYKDNSDRFNSPAQAIEISEVVGNLPYEDDKNTDEYDYCETEEYVTCFGSKIWYVPSSAILEGGELDWSRASEFYFETELIQFNSEGNLIIYPDQTLGLVPSYYVSPTALSGDKIVTTTISPTE